MATLIGRSEDGEPMSALERAIIDDYEEQLASHRRAFALLKMMERSPTILPPPRKRKARRS